ncbi:MAG: Sensor histidine kinase TodS [Bacteroidetes bacterium ADurb.Bin174]|nr:MAG: Sensor histidine kinase TodS [Bacteroidetes bacterium ADurb.Bin174]
MRLKLFVSLIMFFLFLAVKAESNGVDFHFAHLTSNDGISQQHITCMMQDDKGLMWIGTKNGLCLYNGYEIKRYFNDVGDNNSLIHNFIRSIFQDAQKRIWIGTEKGLCRYLPEFDVFQQYDYPQAVTASFVQNSQGDIFCVSGHNLLNRYDETNNTFQRVDAVADSVQIYSLATDDNDRLWIGTDRGLKVYDQKFMHVTEYTALNPNDLTHDVADIINVIFIDKQNNIWVGKNGNGIVRINSKTNEITYWNKTNGLTDGMIRAIEQDVLGRMWVGTEKGVFIFSPDGRIHNIRQDYTDNQGLNDNAIYSIVRDRDDNIWIGTYFGGINILKNDYKQFRHYRAGYSNMLLKGKAVRKIVEEGNGIFWIATEDGGLNRLNEKTGEIKKIEHPSLVDNVHALLYDSVSHELWIGMFRGGLTCYNLRTGSFRNYTEGPSGLGSDMIFSIEMDHDGVLWIASVRGLRYFDKKKNRFECIPHELLSNVFIYTLYVDSKNNIWIGTRVRGLFRYNKKSGEIKSWESKENTPGLSDNFITSVFEDTKHRIWIGTNNGGLHSLDQTSELIKNVDDELSLDENCIYGILEDDNKRLWISTNNGLVSIDTNQNDIRRYTVDEGLPVNQFNYASCLRSKSGRFYFGTVNGLISFHPDQVEIKDRPLNIVLSNLYIGNHIVTARDKKSPLSNSFDETEKIKLTAKQARSFSIEYAAISLGYTSNITYAIKMEGVDREWNYVNKQRRIVYSGLPHGDYLFKVKASSSGLNWDKATERVLAIEILPPFYLSNLAYVIYFLLVLSVLYVVYRVVSIRIKEKNMMKMEYLEKENIKAMNKLKIDFFTNISHELKTPLTLIISPLQSVIEDAALDFGLKSRLQTVLRNAHRMVRLIEELITFNKIESGQTRIRLQKGNPLEFIEEIYYLFKDIADKKDINFELDLEDNGEEVWYSPSYVEKIVNNLLSNAIKFTAEGGSVILSASIVENNEGYIMLNIRVEDTGIGIAREELANVFNNYYQTRRGQNFDPNGWGIGLALTYNLVQIHKGTISVESEVGKGSRFSVLLNVSENAFSPQERSEVKADQNFLVTYNYQKSEEYQNSDEMMNQSLNQDAVDPEMKYTLLVVDDNQELAAFLSEIFSAKYYRVLTAMNGEEALKIARKSNPDIIISDIMMPVMDGITLCSKLKNDLLTSHIPVILLTAKQGQENIISGYESGADMYVEKPFNTQALELMVQNMLRTRERNRKQFKDDPELNITAVAGNPRDEKLLNEIKTFIDDNIENENLSVSDITQAVGVSRTVLHVKMKNLIGMSIFEYVRNLRLNKAKELLKEGFNISETAYKTGFSDPNYFSKCFKKKYGSTPSDYIATFKS